MNAGLLYDKEATRLKQCGLAGDGVLQNHSENETKVMMKHMISRDIG